MKWFALCACLLAGCTGLTVGPPLPAPAARSIKVMSVSPRVTASPSSPVPGVYDVFVVGDPLLWGTWNGSAFDLPVNRAWIKLPIRNVTGASLLQVDTSNDLETWALVGYFTNCPNGILLIDTDPVARRRFYRARVILP